jgi:chromosome segregation ATPase
MANARTQEQDELEQLRNRLDWMDEERLKNGRRMVQLEQRLTAWERELETREKRIKEVELRMTNMTVQLGRVSNLDSQLELFKDELSKMIEQYDQRRIEGYQELDKLRRIEHEVQQRDIAEIRKELKPISRIENELKLRENEDARIAKMASSLQNQIPPIKTEIETWKQELKFVEESERTNASTITGVQASIHEHTKQLESIESRLDITNHSLSKVQVTAQEVADGIGEVQHQIKEWSNQVLVGEQQRNKRIGEWEDVIEEVLADMENYAKEWVKYADQYKEARAAVEALREWQQHIEKQQREAAELARIEANQMRARWEKFSLENDKRWTNYTVEQEQLWAGSERREKQVQEKLLELLELIENIKQDKEILWRVQTAQGEAMKKWPRIWLEEVEKAKTHNPNSRRQPDLVPVREE